MAADFEEVDENGNPVVRPPQTTEDKLRSAEEALKWSYQARDDDRKHNDRRIKVAVREAVLASAVIVASSVSLSGFIGDARSQPQSSRVCFLKRICREPA